MVYVGALRERRVGGYEVGKTRSGAEDRNAISSIIFFEGMPGEPS